MGEETWGCSSQEGWLEWCQANERRLARRFLADMADGEKVRRFFGSWYDVEGRRQTGYFLGCRLVAGLQQARPMRELAVLSPDQMRAAARQYLETGTDS